MMYVRQFSCGDPIGYFGHLHYVDSDLDGKWAIVEDGEYAEGGSGPFIRTRNDGVAWYKSKERAERSLKAYQ